MYIGKVSVGTNNESLTSSKYNVYEFTRFLEVIQAIFESRQLTNIDKNVTNQFGATVFHFAAQNKHSHEPLVYLLKNAMKFNLNINQLCRYQRNVFHDACGFGTEESVKFLIQNAEKYNIDLNLRDNIGYTPFHEACNHGQLQIVKMLLMNSKEHKINVFSVTNHGKDGQAYAKQKGHTDVVNLIKDWKVEPFDQMLTKLKGLEKFGLIEEQKKLLDDVTDLIKAKKQLEKEAIQ